MIAIVAAVVAFGVVALSLILRGADPDLALLWMIMFLGVLVWVTRHRTR